MATDPDKDEKIVLDPVYGTIHLDLLAVKIIDTPLFQRLRYIKQLSFADFVYPGATHTRFAHSIGVYHLARQLIKEIEAHNLPPGAEKMSPEDKRCIRLAALCHDLGHGPFSHLYEQIGEKVLDEAIGSKLKHEHMSLFWVEKLFNDYELKRYLGDNPDKQVELIKDLIERKRELTETENKKKYMFQIVSNKDSGVDVDKWDYFNRDAIACGVPERFQYDRALTVARVVETKEGMFELGYRDYDGFNFYNMFHTRFTLYRKVYKHKVVQAVDLMIKDVVQLVHEANKRAGIEESSKIDLFPITTQTDERYMKLDEANYLDMEKYFRLRDDVLLKIYDSSVEGYKAAQDLLQRLYERKLYKLVRDICVKVSVDEEREYRAEEVPQCDDAKHKAGKIEKAIKGSLNSDDNNDIRDKVEVQLVRFDYGQKHEDPVQKLYFYTKDEEMKGNTLKKDDVSIVLPSVFQEYHVRVFEKFSGNKKYESKVKEYSAKLGRILEDVTKQQRTQQRQNGGKLQVSESKAEGHQEETGGGGGPSTSKKMKQ